MQSLQNDVKVIIGYYIHKSLNVNVKRELLTVTFTLCHDYLNPKYYDAKIIRCRCGKWMYLYLNNDYVHPIPNSGCFLCKWEKNIEDVHKNPNAYFDALML